MSYSDQFETQQAIYRLFRTDHWRVTDENILNAQRIAQLDGIVLEVSGDKKIHNPPETVFHLLSHSNVIRIAESLGSNSPPVFVVDVHMDNILSDVFPDTAASLIGSVLAISGIMDFVKVGRIPVTRRSFVRRLLAGSAKCAMGFPLGTYEKACMVLLGNLKGEIGNDHPLTKDYGDIFVPHLVIGRDAIYARILEEGVVPLIHARKYAPQGSILSTGGNPKVRLDIHCGAGHKRIPLLIQDKKKRDAKLQKYAADDYAVFDDRYLHVFYEFTYDSTSRIWQKKEYDINLFKKHWP